MVQKALAVSKAEGQKKTGDQKAETSKTEKISETGRILGVGGQVQGRSEPQTGLERVWEVEKSNSSSKGKLTLKETTPKENRIDSKKSTTQDPKER